MNWTIRGLFSIATLTFLILVGRSQPQTLLTWSCLVLMAFTYLGVIWLPQVGWTRLKFSLAASFLALLTLVLQLSSQGSEGISPSFLLIPLVLLLGREQQDYRRFATVLAVLTLGFMFTLAPSVSFLLTVIPSVLALYMSIRAINIYKEAYRSSQQDIQALDAAHRELQKTYAALQDASADSMRYAALAERTRLARDIHDGLGHQLTSLIVQLQALEIMLPNDPVQATQCVPGMLAAARQAMAEVHQAVKNWREDESGEGVVALQGLVSQFVANAPISLVFQQEGNLSNWPVEVSVALYRILQEALTNILRHSKAAEARIQVEENDQQVSLTVSDNGCFTENIPLKPGYGLKGIQERSLELGGDCRISQNEPHGLKLEVVIPIPLVQTNPSFSPAERSQTHG